MNVIALLSNCVTTNGICLCLEIEQVSINFVEKDFRKSMEDGGEKDLKLTFQSVCFPRLLPLRSPDQAAIPDGHLVTLPLPQPPVPAAQATDCLQAEVTVRLNISVSRQTAVTISVK